MKAATIETSQRATALTSWEETWHEFCLTTSLHGWTHLHTTDKPCWHRIAWLIVILFCHVMIIFILYGSYVEFANASVSHEIGSPTHTLDDVYFPSMVICNMNFIRRSFIYSLLKDPVMANVTFNDLLAAVDNVFIKGQEQDWSDDKAKLADKIFQSDVYNKLFKEFMTLVRSPDPGLIVTDTFLQRYHTINDSIIAGRDESSLKRQILVEIAAQFRPDELIMQVHFPFYSVYLEFGFATDLGESCVWITPLVLEPLGEEKNDFSTFVPKSYNGINNGVRLLLDAEAYDYASTLSGSEGFTLGILHYLDIPILRHSGLNIPTGHSVQLAVSPTIKETSIHCKRRFDPVRRQCYFDDEIDLSHFKIEEGYRYNMANCLYEASLQQAEEHCNCTLSKFVEVSDGYRVCEGNKKKCINDIMADIGSIRTVSDHEESKECLSNCEDQEYSFRVSQDEFCIIYAKLTRSCSGDRRESLDVAQPFLCKAMDEAHAKNITCPDIQNFYAGEKTASTVLGTLQNEISKYVRDNVALLNVHIRDPYVTKYLTEEKITVITFVGNIGGLVGLFSGFSFISVVEIIYFLSLGRIAKTKSTKPATGRGKKVSPEREEVLKTKCSMPSIEVIQ